MPMRYLTSANCLWYLSIPDGLSSTTDEVGEDCTKEMSIHSSSQMEECEGTVVSPMWEAGFDLHSSVFNFYLFIILVKAIKNGNRK